MRVSSRALALTSGEGGKGEYIRTRIYTPEFSWRKYWRKYPASAPSRTEGLTESLDLGEGIDDQPQHREHGRTVAADRRQQVVERDRMAGVHDQDLGVVRPEAEADRRVRLGLRVPVGVRAVHLAGLGLDEDAVRIDLLDQSSGPAGH